MADVAIVDAQPEPEGPATEMKPAAERRTGVERPTPLLRTIWALGVPQELRDTIEAAMPDRVFRFLLTTQPLAERRDRITGSGGACVASWGDARTSDLAEFLAETGVPYASLGPVALQGPVEPNGAVAPYGFFLDRRQDVPEIGAGLGRRTGISGSRSPADLARIEAALTTFAESGITLLNHGSRGVTAQRSTRRSVVIVADEQDGLTAPSQKRFAAYQELVRITRERYPGWEITFVTNLDYFIPDAVVAAIVAGVDKVVHAAYSPQMLTGCEAVVVHNSFAGFDAFLRKIPVVSIGDNGLAAALQSRTAAADVFASLLLDDVAYVDPVAGTPVAFDEAVKLIAARAAQRMPPRAAPPRAWRTSETSKRLNTRPAGGAPRPAPGAVRPRTAGALANLKLPEKKPLSKEEAERPRKLIGADHLVLPPWLAAEAPDGWAAGAVVGLEHDIHVSGAAFIASLEAVKPLSIDVEPGTEASADRIAKFATRQPELYLRLMKARLGRSGARLAVISDLRDPAVRLFSRAAAQIGVPRLYVPVAPEVGIDPGLRLRLEAIGSLADVVLAWNDNHRGALEELGYPADRIIDVDPGLGSSLDVSDRNCILVSLARQWPLDRKIEAVDADDFVLNLISLADAFGYGIVFHLGPDFLASLPERGLRIVQEAGNSTLELAGAEVTGLPGLLGQASIVLCDSAAMQRQAQKVGLVGLMLQHGATGEEGGRNICGSAAAVRSLLASRLDELSLGASGETTREAEPIGAAIARLLSGEAGLAPLPAVDQRLLSGETLSFALVSSTIPAAELERTQRHLLPMIGAQRWVRTTAATSLSDMIDIDLMVQWGIRSNPQKEAVDLNRRRLGIGRLLLEDGFIRSVNIGLSGDPTLSIVMDDLTPFYDATRPSRLETILNDPAFVLSEEETARARGAIDLITGLKVTKYNFAAYRRLDLGAPERKKILVVDQRAGDQSIESGLASPASFQAMVMAAIELSRDHDVIIKTHPDANIGGKDSAIGGATLDSVRANPAVTVVTDDMNPYSLIDVVDKVFVVTSGLGFEALMAGKEVWCFGVPFYAGWGLTKDRVRIPRRTQKRSVEEVFHVFYVGLSRYFDPVTQQPCEVERVVRYIADIRPWRMPDETTALGGPEGQPAGEGVTAPAEVPTPLQEHPLAADATVWALNFSPWKRDYLQGMFRNHRVEFVDAATSIQDISSAIRDSHNPAFVVWGRSTRPGLGVLCKRWGIPLFRMEDGFVRSVGLGADKILPYSFCLDSRGIYFDATEPSDLEVILANYDFDADPELVAEAAACRQLLVEKGLSKYNFPYPTVPGGPFGAKYGKRVLVIGQVEDDASIEFGGPPGGVTNNDLVRLARAENPDAQVIYKIHPDVLAGRRAYNSDPADVAGICEISSGPLSLHDAFHEVDHVYTITSLAGFEALMRGIEVTTVGAPFYAGWGLTDTRMETPRRGRTLTIDQLFAGAYMLYAKYADPESGEVLDLRAVIEEIDAQLGALAAPVFQESVYDITD